MVNLKNCGICNKLFEAKYVEKFCSDDCKIEARKLRDAKYTAKHKTIIDKNCLICNKSFTTNNDKYCYCGEECSKIGRREKGRIAERELYNRNKLDKVIERNCLICSVKFETTDSRKKYCGAEVCSAERKKQKNKRAEDNRLSKLRQETVERQIITKIIKLNKVKAYVSSRGYTLLSDEYVRNSEKIVITCASGHIWEVSYHNFKDLEQNCPICNLSIFQSGPEKEIVKHFKDNFPNLNIVERDKITIGKELDIYFPDQKVAVEYCGLYWHGEAFANKKRVHHRIKMDLCQEKDIRLITIFEDEYLERASIVISRIENSLGLTKEKIFARKCELKIVEQPEHRVFFDQYHLQGSSSTQICFGLYYENKLVQAMSFGSLSRKHAGDETVIELKRLANAPGIQIVGGASKLFSAAKKWTKDKGFSSIKSYCDMRWAGLTPIYQTLGFELVGETNYTPHYFKGQRRYRNQGLRKTPEERLTGKTEWELRKEQGFDRIWDCGHRTYRYIL